MDPSIARPLIRHKFREGLRGMSRDLEGKYRELENSQRAHEYYAGCRGTSRAKAESSQKYTELAGVSCVKSKFSRIVPLVILCLFIAHNTSLDLDLSCIAFFKKEKRKINKNHN